MSTRTLAVLTLLAVTTITTGGLALAAGASWPAALLSAVTVTLTVAGLLPRGGGHGGGSSPQP